MGVTTAVVDLPVAQITVQALVDCIELTVAGQSVVREVACLGSPTQPNNRAEVDVAEPLATDPGLVVRPVSQAATPFHRISAASNNAVLIKNSPGTLFSWSMFNASAGGYPVYVKFYDKASGPPNPATDVPVATIGVQAGLSRELSLPRGLVFNNGIGMAIVKGISDTDNTPVAAGDCSVDISYL